MKALNARLEQHRRRVIEGLLAAVVHEDAERLASVMVNFETCAELAFIPALRRVADQDLFFTLDDNGAGGMPRPSGEGTSMRATAEHAIASLEENERRFAPRSELAQALTSSSAALVASVLDGLVSQPVADASLLPLLPLLERIADVDAFAGTRLYRLRRPALVASAAIRASLEGRLPPTIVPAPRARAGRTPRSGLARLKSALRLHLSEVGPRLPLEAVVEAMVLCDFVHVDALMQVAGHPASSALVPLIVSKRFIALLSELLMRRRCAGLTTDPEPLVPFVLEQVHEVARGRDRFGTETIIACAEELDDPRVLAALGSIDCRAPGLALGPALERADALFVSGDLDHTTACAYRLYARALRAAPSAHAAFQLAWLDRAFGAPPVPERVAWLRTLGFQDERLLQRLATPLEWPLSVARSRHRPDARYAKVAFAVGVPGLASSEAGRAAAHEHLAAVAAACPP